jgi:PQQ-like domain
MEVRHLRPRVLLASGAQWSSLRRFAGRQCLRSERQHRRPALEIHYRLFCVFFGGGGQWGVYVGSGDNNVYALNANTGSLLWKYATGAPVNDSSPSVANGVVYVGSYDDKVYALKAATGTLVWSYATGGIVDSSPAVARSARQSSSSNFSSLRMRAMVPV